MAHKPPFFLHRVLQQGTPCIRSTYQHDQQLSPVFIPGPMDAYCSDPKLFTIIGSFNVPATLVSAKPPHTGGLITHLNDWHPRVSCRKHPRHPSSPGSRAAPDP